MNATRLKYAKERAENMLNEKAQQIRQKHTTQAVSLTKEQKLEALRMGQFEVKDKVNHYSGSYLEDYVIFPQETPAIVNEDAIAESLQTLRKKYTILVDELMLGDNEIALRLLREFEKL